MFVFIEHGDAYSTRNFDRSVRCNARTISDFLCRLSDSVGPVCPQKLPDIANEQEALERMPKGRLEYLKRLLPHLRNQSEDCLYLNIYAPAMGEWTVPTLQRFNRTSNFVTVTVDYADIPSRKKKKRKKKLIYLNLQ